LDKRARIFDCKDSVSAKTQPQISYNTCKLAISFLSSFCPDTSPPTAVEAVAEAEAKAKMGALAESRAHPDADDGVSPPECRTLGAAPEKDGAGLV
jgi:hypothetical protein